MSSEAIQVLFVYLRVIIPCPVVAFCIYGNGQNEEVHYSCIYQRIYESLFDVEIPKWVTISFTVRWDNVLHTIEMV